MAIARIAPMKNFYTSTLKFVLSFLLLLTFNAVNAQLNYTFVTSTETFQPLTGASVVATATSTNSLTNTVYTLPNGTIPFGFYFNGGVFTGFTISSHGFITFSAAPSASNTNPLSSTATYAGALSIMGRGLTGNFKTVVTTDPDTIATISYKTNGVAPNRKFIIEWANFRPNTASTAPNLYLQIRLSEGSNNIDYIYGNFSGATWNNSTCQVGLRGANNTLFQNRALVSGQPWTATTAGTLNNSSIAYTSTTLPVNGQVFSFLAPCPTPINLGLVDAMPTSVILRWSSGLSSSLFPGSSYRVEWGPSGFTPGTGTIVNTPDTFLALNSLTTGASYQYYVSRNCTGTGNGLSIAAGPKNFTTGGVTEDCSNAQLLSISPNLAGCTFTTVTSGISQNGPVALCSDAQGGNIPDDDRWYKFVAPATNKKIVITTSAGTVADWVMEVWNACPGGAAYAVKCADDVNAAMPEISLCQNEYVAGQTYYIRVWTYSQTANGNMTMCIYQDTECPIPPSYDECISAAVFPINPVQYCPGNELVFTTDFATPSGTGGANGAAPSCDPNSSFNDVFLTFNTGSTGTFNLTFNKITATDLRAQLLFECGAGGLEIQCFNPAQGTFTLTGLNPVANYVLRVWSPVGTSGTFSVCAQDACDDATATISGFSTICTTGIAQLRVDLTGLPPWNVTYTNGTSNFSFTTSTTPYFIPVSPTVSTFYSLVSVTSPICSGTVSGNASVTVVPPPTVTLANFTNSVCSNQTITLTGGSPVGGSYSGTGVSGSQFNATTAGVGVHTITYTYGVGNGCQRSASKPITVIQGPGITSFAPAVSPVGSTITITGTGFTGVNQVKFNNTFAVTFTVVNSTTITAVVPVGATTGFLTVFSSNGCSSQSMTTFGVGTPAGVNLTVKAFIEGYYSGGGLMVPVVDPVLLPTKADTIIINLHQTVSPFGLVATRTALMNTNGTATVSFPGAQVGNFYYIALKGRNIIETWSKTPVQMQSGNMTFDFTVPGSALLRQHVVGSGSGGYIENSDLQTPEKPEHPE